MKEQIKYEVICNNCMWEGNENDLKLIVDLSDNDISHDINYMKGCPNCETDSYLMDAEQKINTLKTKSNGQN